MDLFFLVYVNHVIQMEKLKRISQAWVPQLGLTVYARLLTAHLVKQNDLRYFI